jgi:uncharacterized protein YicC (UPF0701 family)
MSERTPTAKAWLVGVVGVAIAILLGWMLIAIGSHKIKKAEEIRVASEAKLQIAVSYAADEAIEELRKARLALGNQNWGSAQTTLSTVGTRVKLINDVAPEGDRGAVNEVQQQLDELQTAVGQQAPDSSQKLDALEAALDKMRQQ